MPDGIPARLPGLLWLAVEHGWDVDLTPYPRLTVSFHRGHGEQIDLKWDHGKRLESAEYDPGNGQDWQRMLLRDIPSILRGGGS